MLTFLVAHLLGNLRFARQAHIAPQAASPTAVPVIASGWIVIVGPTPSAAPPLAAEGRNHDKPTVEAVVVKSPVVEFAKMAVVEPVKFAKARMKSAAVECWESGMQSATVEC